MFAGAICAGLVASAVVYEALDLQADIANMKAPGTVRLGLALALAVASVVTCLKAYPRVRSDVAGERTAGLVGAVVAAVLVVAAAKLIP
jgi:hypothetical protein